MDEQPDERRAACRYTASAHCAIFVGWPEGGAFRTIEANLRDLSLLGAAVEVDECPPPAVPIWVAVRNAHAYEWVESNAVEARQGSHRRYLLRLEFKTPCSYDFFRWTASAFESLGEGAASPSAPASAPAFERSFPRADPAATPAQGPANSGPRPTGFGIRDRRPGWANGRP